MSPYDVLIIGGGVAGSAAAIQLAGAGKRVALVEKEAGPRDKVCGEFLSQEAIEYLFNLGLDLGSLGAVPIRRIRLASNELESEAALPFGACSLSRRVLDENLLALAAKAGVKIIRGSRVHVLDPLANGHFAATVSNGLVLEGRHAILATGKHNLLGWERAQGKQNDLLGFKMHWRLSQSSLSRLDDAVDIIIFSSGYCGLQQVEDGWANLGLLIKRSVFAEHYRHWDRLISHLCSTSNYLSAYLADAQPRWKTPLAVSDIPYGYICGEAERIWRVGDQAAVIPSFSGSGISIALHTALLAASAIVGGRSQVEYYRRLRSDLLKKVSFATLLSRAMVGSVSNRAISSAARWIPGALEGVARATRIRH
jgi:flavin-dependent dehydrogenase